MIPRKSWDIKFISKDVKNEEFPGKEIEKQCFWQKEKDKHSKMDWKMCLGSSVTEAENEKAKRWLGTRRCSERIAEIKALQMTCECS